MQRRMRGNLRLSDKGYGPDPNKAASPAKILAPSSGGVLKTFPTPPPDGKEMEASHFFRYFNCYSVQTKNFLKELLAEKPEIRKKAEEIIYDGGDFHLGGIEEAVEKNELDKVEDWFKNYTYKKERRMRLQWKLKKMMQRDAYNMAIRYVVISKKMRAKDIERLLSKCQNGEATFKSCVKTLLDNFLHKKNMQKKLKGRTKEQIEAEQNHDIQDLENKFIELCEG